MEEEGGELMRVSAVNNARIGFSSARNCITSVRDKPGVRPEHVLGVACSSCTDGKEIDFTIHPHAEMGVEMIKRVAWERIKGVLKRETVAA